MALLASFTVLASHAAETPPAAKPAEPPRTQPNSLLEHLETLAAESNRVSYAVGVNIGRNLKANYPNLNLNFLLLGINDEFDGTKLKLSEDLINASIARYQEAADEHVRTKVSGAAALNLDRTEKFLQVNGKKDGVMTTSSGLQYRILSKGAGPAVKAEGVARVQLHGKALSGRVVDSTLVGDERKARQIRLADALPFWREVLPQMPLGAKWELYVHPKLAYGEKGGEKVGPNELLIYTAEIVGLE